MKTIYWCKYTLEHPNDNGVSVVMVNYIKVRALTPQAAILQTLDILGVNEGFTRALKRVEVQDLDTREIVATAEFTTGDSILCPDCGRSISNATAGIIVDHTLYCWRCGNIRVDQMEVNNEV